MKIKKMINSPVLQHMHPGNPHGLRFADGDEGQEGSGGSGDDPDDDEGDDDEGDEDEEGDDLEGLLDDEDDDDEDDDEEITVKRGDLAAMIESAVDRRINKKVQSRIQRGRQTRRSGSGGTSRRAWAPSRDDVREAREGFREALDDIEFRFVSKEERLAARELAESRLQSSLTEGADPYEVGADVAEEVVEQMKTLRKSYERKAVATLRARGVIKDKPGQKTGKGARKTDQAGFETGAARAARMFPDRVKTGDK